MLSLFHFRISVWIARALASAIKGATAELGQPVATCKQLMLNSWCCLFAAAQTSGRETCRLTKFRNLILARSQQRLTCQTPGHFQCERRSE